MNETVYQKSAAGAAEIQARQMRLHPRLRSLLVLIDGKHNVGKLLETVAALGVNEEHIAELARLGLIEAIGAGVAASTVAPVAAAPAEAPAPEAEAAPTAPATSEGVEQIRALYAFFNDAVRDNLGLRGFMLQLQVEKAESLEDYREIRDTFLASVRKSKGEEVARQFEKRIATLLPG
ncbi:hypothetical protein [Niveibacterium sp. SC-1]|uniref:hypothetical protein n=1 Tax=Niveibacterium sp. SC-1 TaxID=3135646 RepID=UPI00311F0371